MDNFDVDAFFASEEFNALGEGHKDILREFAQKAAGGSQTDALALFMEYRGRFDIDFNSQKRLMDALKAGLSPESRKKLALMEMLYNRNGR